MKTDHRSVQRIPFRVAATLHVAGKECRAESTENLSLRGVFLRTDQVFEQDLPCEVLLELSGVKTDLRLRMEGRVASIRPNEGLGIEFTRLDLEVYTLLKNIVEYNSAATEEQPIVAFDEKE